MLWSFMLILCYYFIYVITLLVLFVYSCYYFKCLGYLCLFVFLLCKYLYYGVAFLFLLFTNLFCLLKLTENNKKRKYESSGVCCLKSYFGTNWLIFIVILSMFQFKLFDFYINMWFKQRSLCVTRSYYLTISRKGVPWKFWLDPRFSRNLKLKWILKWLPLDRGCFKFYFLQKEKVH